ASGEVIRCLLRPTLYGNVVLLVESAAIVLINPVVIGIALLVDAPCAIGQRYGFKIDRIWNGELLQIIDVSFLISDNAVDGFVTERPSARSPYTGFVDDPSMCI